MNHELRNGEKLQNLIMEIENIVNQIRTLKSELTIVKLVKNITFFNKKLYTMICDNNEEEIKFQNLNYRFLSLKCIDLCAQLKNGNFVWKVERLISEGLLNLRHKLEEYYIKETKEKIKMV